MYKRIGISLFTASLILSGCGGGGGSSSSTATASSVGYDGATTAVELTTTTAPTVAKKTASSLLDTDLGSLTDGLMGKPGVSTINSDALGPFTNSLIDFAMSKVDEGSPIMLASESDSVTIPCYDNLGNESGSITISYTVADLYSETPSAGDTVNMTFNTCNNGSGTIMTGGFKFVAKSFDINTTTGATNVSYSITFSNLKTTESSGDYNLINGGFTMAMVTGSDGSMSFTMTGDALLNESQLSGVSVQEAITNFSMIDSIDASQNFEADRDFTYYGFFDNNGEVSSGYVEVETTTPVYVYAGDTYPSVGTVIISDAYGASTRLVALDNTSLRIDYDLDGDGEYGLTDPDDPASETVAWTSL